MSQIRTRATWGRRKERSEQELNKLCGDAFRALKIPTHWKFEGYERCKLHADETSEIQSIGAWFLDTKTKGINTKRYRIWFHTYSERLGILERAVVDISRFKETSLASYLTPEKMNEFINSLNDD